MYPESLLWSILPTPKYSYGLCYAAHAAHLHTFWTGKHTTLLEVVNCSPPRGFGGDPGVYFQQCTPALATFATLNPTKEVLYDHLLRGPLLVGLNGHALILRGYTPKEWILVDTKPLQMEGKVTFDYSLGI